MTESQQRLVNSIKEYYKQNGQFPTQAELAKFIGGTKQNINKKYRKIKEITPEIVEEEGEREYKVKFKRKKIVLTVKI